MPRVRAWMKADRLRLEQSRPRRPPPSGDARCRLAASSRARLPRWKSTDTRCANCSSAGCSSLSRSSGWPTRKTCSARSCSELTFDSRRSSSRIDSRQIVRFVDDQQRAAALCRTRRRRNRPAPRIAPSRRHPPGAMPRAAAAQGWMERNRAWVLLISPTVSLPSCVAQEMAQQRGLAGADLAREHAERRLRLERVFEHGQRRRMLRRREQERRIRIHRERLASAGGKCRSYMALAVRGACCRSPC